jgi:hypothetical protein
LPPISPAEALLARGSCASLVHPRVRYHSGALKPHAAACVLLVHCSRTASRNQQLWARLCSDTGWPSRRCAAGRGCRSRRSAGEVQQRARAPSTAGTSTSAQRPCRRHLSPQSPASHTAAVAARAKKTGKASVSYGADWYEQTRQAAKGKRTVREEIGELRAWHSSSSSSAGGQGEAPALLAAGSVRRPAAAAAPPCTPLSLLLPAPPALPSRQAADQRQRPNRRPPHATRRVPPPGQPRCQQR